MNLAETSSGSNPIGVLILVVLFVLYILLMVWVVRTLLQKRGSILTWSELAGFLFVICVFILSTNLSELIAGMLFSENVERVESIVMIGIILSVFCVFVETAIVWGNYGFKAALATFLSPLLGAFFAVIAIIAFLAPKKKKEEKGGKQAKLLR